MKALAGVKINDNKLQVTTMYYEIPDSMSQDQRNELVFVDDILQIEDRIGKYGLLYVDPITGEQWVEYADRPLTLEEEVKIRVNDIEQALAAILGGAI